MKYFVPKLLLIILAMIFQSCHINNEKATSNFTLPESLSNYGFVISCGAGCALTYNCDKIDQNDKSFTLTFKVEMFVDEEIVETNYETYIFKTAPNQIILDESGNDLSKDRHPKLLNELSKVYDHIE